MDTLKTISDYEREWPLREKRLTCGCPMLDKLIFSGGFRISTINEIVGAASSGKTQFCLQCLATVQLPEDRGGLNGEGIYISTEDCFPINRFNQIAQSFGLDSPGQHVYIERIIEKDSFVNCILNKLPKLLEKRSNVRLLIIDSIAAPFRSEFSLKTIRERTKTIQSLSLQLQSLANQFNLIVICTNQVSDRIGSNEKNPYLGLTWSNHLTNSFYLRRDEINQQQRSIEIRFSADKFAFASIACDPVAKCPYEINSHGVRYV